MVGWRSNWLLHGQEVPQRITGMGTPEIRVTPIAALIYPAATVAQHIVKIRDQLDAGRVDLESYSTNFILTQPVDGVDPIRDSGIFFRHLESALNAEAPHLLQNDEIVGFSCLRHPAVRRSVSINPDFSFMLGEVFVEEGTHFRYVGIV